MPNDELLAYYAAPGIFTGVEGFEAEVDAMPDDIPSVVAAVQGLLIHEGLGQIYRIELTAEKRAERELHLAAAMLSRAISIDSRALTEARPPAGRVGCVCRHFATLFVAILRHKGIPARARCGFANYFDPAKSVDHWVGEYWNSGESRWVLVDAQVDAPQRAVFKVGIDTLDVPRDRFLVAGDAWRLCRTGAADPATFGVAGTENWELVEVFGDLFQDLAALQKIELLPWGWYGLALDEGACESETALLDRLAALSSAADAAALAELRAMIAADSRLAVPPERLAEIEEADRAATRAAPV